LRRLWLPLLALLLAPALALPPLVRHVDPALVPEQGPDALALARLYLQYSSSLARLDLGSARLALGNASAAYVPERLRAAYGRLVELLSSYTGALNETKVLLDLAAALYGRGDYGSALAALRNASEGLVVAEARYYDAEAAAAVLRLLGLPQGALGRVLSDMRSPLDALAERYRQLLSSVREALNTSVGARLEIRASRSEVLWGERLGVSGRLTSERGYGIPGRVVLVHVGPETHRVITGSDGSFSFELPVRVYSRVLRVYAEFPSDGIHRYARSEDVYVRVIFFEPALEAWLDNATCLPGRSVTLHVRAGEGLEVAVRTPFGFGASFVSNGSPRALPIPVPPTAPEGTYTVEVSSSPKGLIGPGLVRLRLNVTRLDFRVNVRAPSFLLAGLAYTITVAPEVESSLEVRATGCADMRVSGWNVTVAVSPLCLDRSVVLELQAEPLDPAYRPARARLELPVYNPLAIIPAALALAAVLLSAPARVRAAPAAAAAGSAVAEVQQQEGAQGDGLRRLLLSLFSLLERLSGARFEPSYTIREYLRVLGGRLSEPLLSVVRSFMLRLELVLYSQLERERSLIERVLRAFLGALGAGS